MSASPGTGLQSLLAFPARHPALHDLIQRIVRPVRGLRQILSEMAAETPHRRILDYGSGEGLFCEVFDPDRYLGYDIDGRSVAYAASRYPRYRFTSRLPESFADIDLVLFNGVLHHMRPEDVTAIFGKIARECPEGAGVILVEPLPARAHATWLSAQLLRLECLLHGTRPDFVSSWLGHLKSREYAVARETVYQHYGVARIVLRTGR